MGKPKVFIGSSVESVGVANAIQEGLEYDAHCHVWTHAFGLGEATIPELQKKLSSVDFAIFVLGPDDEVLSRKRTMPAPRDNVVLELGMSLMVPGVDRTFCLVPRDMSVKVPSDYLGITLGDYDPGNPDLNSAVGTFCNKVRRKLKDYSGPADDLPVEQLPAPPSPQSGGEAATKGSSALQVANRATFAIARSVWDTTSNTGSYILRYRDEDLARVLAERLPGKTDWSLVSARLLWRLHGDPTWPENQSAGVAGILLTVEEDGAIASAPIEGAHLVDKMLGHLIRSGLEMTMPPENLRVHCELECDPDSPPPLQQRSNRPGTDIYTSLPESVVAVTFSVDSGIPF